MGTVIAFTLLVFCFLCVAALWLDYWLCYRDLERWERRQKYRDGGSDKPSAFTGMSPPTGTPFWTGLETRPETTADSKSTSVRGLVMPPTDFRETPPMRLVSNSYPWLIESGKRTGEDGADNGPIPPGNAA